MNYLKFIDDRINELNIKTTDPSTLLAYWLTLSEMLTCLYPDVMEDMIHKLLHSKEVHIVDFPNALKKNLKEPNTINEIDDLKYGKMMLSSFLNSNGGYNN